MQVACIELVHRRTRCVITASSSKHPENVPFSFNFLTQNTHREHTGNAECLLLRCDAMWIL
jgi:hypothetical protein